MDFENTTGSIANLIDHTLLKTDTTREEMSRLCAEAKEYGFASVCIPPYFVAHCKSQLEDSTVKICTVVGFPLGFDSSFAKVEAIKRALSDGADEIDAVVNIAAIKDENWSYVRNEVQSFARATHIKGKIIKLILETSLLEKEELVKLCDLLNQEELDFVKTSTGFDGGASTEIVAELRKLLKPEIKIKASGGIDTAEKAKQLVKAGANRIGTSNALELI